MAHEIDQTRFAEGQALYAVKPAWHGLGQVLPGTFTSFQAIEQVGLGFNVSKRKLVTVDGVLLPDYVATVRDDSNAVLGVVGKDFEPLQNKTMFSVLDQAVAETGVAVEYESAGSLKGGREVWALARLAQPINLPGQDTVWKYFLALNGHDGSRGVVFMPTTVRVVCANTASAAEAGRERRFAWRHTRNINNNIENMVAAVRGCIEDLKSWGEIAEKMAVRQLETDAEIDTFKALIGDVIDATITGGTDEAKARKLQAFNLILGHFASGVDPMNPGDQPTIWRAYNAVSQWIEHESVRSRSQETRFAALMFGTQAVLKSRAFRRLAGLL